jgi:hypothetical protein
VKNPKKAFLSHSSAPQSNLKDSKSKIVVSVPFAYINNVLARFLANKIAIIQYTGINAKI